MAATGEELRSSELRDAMLRGDDPAALSPILAPSVVLHSPILSTPFEGRDAVAHLLSTVNGVVEDIRYTHQMTDGAKEALMFDSRIRGQELQATLLIEFDDEGLISDIDVFFRPLRAIAAFASAVGPLLAKSPGGARLMRVLSPMLPAMAASADFTSRRTIRLR
jgi:hypothetical protein